MLLPGLASTWISEFKSTTLPTMSLVDYIIRFATSTKCSKASLVGAVCLVRRMRGRVPDRVAAVSRLHAHRLILAALCLSTKMSDDDALRISNSFYARIGGVEPDELVDLEGALLKLLDFSCLVKDKEHAACLESLRRKRGMSNHAGNIDEVELCDLVAVAFEDIFNTSEEKKRKKRKRGGKTQEVSAEGSEGESRADTGPATCPSDNIREWVRYRSMSPSDDAISCFSLSDDDHSSGDDVTQDREDTSGSPSRAKKVRISSKRERDRGDATFCDHNCLQTQMCRLCCGPPLDNLSGVACSV